MNRDLAAFRRASAAVADWLDIKSAETVHQRADGGDLAPRCLVAALGRLTALLSLVQLQYAPLARPPNRRL